MRVMLDDMYLAVSEVECLSMDMDGREDRSLAKIRKFHPTGEGQFY